MPQLDAMRFFAFLCVFFFHGLPSNDVGSHVGRGRVVALIESTLRRSGEEGVALFFLLSAFLITELLRREKEKTGTISLKMFYIRRGLRIWPLYYLVVGIGLVLQLVSPAFHLGAVGVLTYLFFLKNWDVAFHGWNWNPIYILWTISSEEQFYLVWPLAQRLLDRRWMLRLCAVAIVLIPAITFWPAAGFVGRHITQLPYLFLYFPIGGVLSYVVTARGRTPLKGGQCAALLLAGLGLWIGGTLLEFPGGDTEGPLGMLVAGKLLAVPGTILIFMAFLRTQSFWWPRPLVYLGKISYGLYVFHVLALWVTTQATGWVGLPIVGGHPGRALLIRVGVVVPVAFCLTVATATLSYEFFEKRFLQLKERFTVIHSRVA